MCFRDPFDPQIAEQSRFPGSAPGPDLQVREFCFCRQIVLIAVQHKAHLVEVITIQFTIEYHIRECLPDGHLIGIRLALAGGIFLHSRLPSLLKMLAGKEAIVAFQIEFQTALMQPVHDMTALLRRDQLMHDHLIMVFDIASIATDHAVQANLPQVRINLGLAAAGTDVDTVSVFPCLTDCLYR